MEVGKMANRAVLIIVALALLGCRGGQTNRESYADAVLNRPLPASNEQRVQECNQIRAETARRQSLAQIGATTATSPLVAAAFQATARQNVAALEARASNIQCTAAFSSTPAPAPTQSAQ